jgi:hypothetical protein
MTRRQVLASSRVLKRRSILARFEGGPISGHGGGGSEPIMYIDHSRIRETQVFVVEGTDSEGYVVASVMATHEDQGDHLDPSALLGGR